MKRSIIIGNWKMYATSIADAHVLATTIRNHAASVPNLEVVLCPPTIWLSEIAEILKKGKVRLGAQNIYFESDGAYTGEISAGMVKEMADFVIVGHSERREYFGETDMDVNEKVLAAIKAGLTPIVCVGEKKKDLNSTQPIKELKEAIAGLPLKKLKDIIVAYEPIWAITTRTTQNNADPDYVARVHTKLRELVHVETPIIYGGSVKSANVESYASRPEIDGALVGTASLRAADFVKICQVWSESMRMKIDERGK